MSKQKKKIAAKPEPAAIQTHKETWFESRQAYFIVFAFAFLLYANTLGHGFVMDDGAVITNHETVKKGLAGIKDLFGQSSVFGSTKENFGTYRPLTMSLFAAEWQFFKDSSPAYHFIHVLLYALLCVVVLIFLQKLLKDYNPLLPFFSALLFAAHPIHTEVAANIKSADEILSLLFCLLASLMAFRFAEDSKMKFAFASFTAFLCGLFSKESSATFLIIIQLALFLFLSSNRKQALTLFGFHISALLIYFFARNAALDPNPPPIGVVNNALAAAPGFSERYATIFFILLRYLGLLLYPSPLCWDYGYNQIPLVGFSNMGALVSLLFYTGMGGYAAFAILGRRKMADGRSVLSFCILFYLIALSVSSNIFVLIGSTMAERFLFAPSLGFCVLLGWGIILAGNMGNRNPDRISNPVRIDTLSSIVSSVSRTSLMLVVVVLLLYSYKTFSRNQDWKSNLTLFAKGVENSPNSYRTNVTYAWESVKTAEKETDAEKKKILLQHAVTYYKKGLSIYGQADADWYNYGVANSNLGNTEEAIQAYEKALQLNPKHRNALYNLATAYLGKKDFQNALRCFSRAYEIEPDFMDVAFKVGVIYHMGGNPQQAIPYYERYYKNHPQSLDVVTNLEIAYRTLGNAEKEKYFKEMRMKMQAPK